MRTVTLSACAGATLLSPRLAATQPLPDAGSTLRQLEPPTITLPRKPPPGAEIQPPARPALKPAPAIRFKLKAVRISGVTAIPENELQALVQEYVGREIGIQELGEGVGRITGFYSRRGFPLATAYLPAQEIEGGVVEIIVLEGRYGDVRLSNASHVSDRAIAGYLESLPGGIVEEASLERKLLLIYDLPGVAGGKAVLSPGQAVGDTDLRVEVQAGARIAASVELDNYGSRYSGANRLSGQLDFNSPARLGDWLSVRATKGDPGLEYGRIGYQLPVGGDGLQLGAGYSHVHYQLGKDFAPVGATGEADSGSVFASYPLVRSRQLSLYGRLGYEYKTFQDRIAAPAAFTDKRSGAAAATLSGSYFDALGAGAASAFSVGYLNGRLTIETPAAKVVDEASARTDGSFQKWTASYVRLQNLSEPLSLYVLFFGQKANKNLDSAEKFILGGPYGVRAYPQGEAPGDTGYLLTAELRYTFSPGAMPGTWQLAGFLDTGQVTVNEVPFAQGPHRRRLSGGGIGLNWIKTNDFSVRIAVAHRIGNEPATSGPDDPTRAWLQAIKSF